MYLTLIVAFAVVLGLVVIFRIRRNRRDDMLEHYSITPEALHTLLASNPDVVLLDVRQPLDLLADAEIIPGSKRIPPKEVLQNPSLLPTDKDLIAYCTCPGDKTSRTVIRRARALHLERVKFLKGGLAAWKAKGYPVDPYQESFHLDTAT